MHEPRVAVVDPYSSGAMLAEQLHSTGIALIAIESSSSLPSAMRTRFQPAHFQDVLSSPREESQLLNDLASFRPTHVIAGFESGVELAERLSHALGLPCNAQSLAPCRRDKFEMAQQAAACGLATPKQCAARELPELLEFAEQQLTWPVIVKPTKSVASDQVHLCSSPLDLQQAHSAIVGQTNVLGQCNERALVQEFISGTEYVVDAVRCYGRTKITGFWQYERPEKANDFVPYDMMRLLPNHGELQTELARYTIKLLDSLGFHFGAAHCELMWSDGAPVLIEVNARLSAGLNATLSGQCGGHSQLDELVKSIISPEQFVSDSYELPTLHQAAVNIFLAPARAGHLVRTQLVDRLNSLATLHSLSIASTPGSWLAGVSGRVTLVSANLSLLEQDIRTVRDCQRSGIFVLAPQVVDDAASTATT
ncbi:MAG: ATP-grasp domain-containing protein [Planctomycetales bacterium]|nr:ATP-grasp domain-containing protein [Planctomycetales bacterium]